MKNFWNYVENHIWAQLAIDAALVFAFFGFVETVYPLIHGGETIQDAFAAWVRL
jgi:hypothetical protein